MIKRNIAFITTPVNTGFTPEYAGNVATRIDYNSYKIPLVFCGEKESPCQTTASLIFGDYLGIGCQLVPSPMLNPLDSVPQEVSLLYHSNPTLEDIGVIINAKYQKEIQELLNTIETAQQAYSESEMIFVIAPFLTVNALLFALSVKQTQLVIDTVVPMIQGGQLVTFDSETNQLVSESTAYVKTTAHVKDTAEM